MRYRLTTLLIALVVGPPGIAVIWFFAPWLPLVIDAIATDSGWLSLAGVAPALGILGTWLGLAFFLASSKPSH